MSLDFNVDKQILSGTDPKIVGSNNFIVRSGSGSDEKEVFRTLLDSNTGLPRLGINRTGTKVESITVNENQQGNGYTVPPSVELSYPDPNDITFGTRALASALINNGQVVAIVVDNQGEGYTSPPSVTITGGGGSGAAATAVLDTVDFELDINGAIRTSTSIISDTAKILNLDIDNFVTPDANFRAPNLKTWANNSGIPWAPSTILQKGEFYYQQANIYEVIETGLSGVVGPTHNDGIELNGEATLKHIGFRVINPDLPLYGETGDSGIYPRSITPQLGDNSDKIATTEYVLNLATNDVGGRVYVSQSIGDDSNDGRSAAAPVRTIKRACQIASQTVGIKESVIIAGGDYVEDNPISIPPDCSIVGDNLRLVIVRPANPDKHIFKFGDKNYVIGVTYRDQINSAGDPVATWDFAMVFDDKQRVYFDRAAGGDFGRNFPIGHQIFGPPKSRADFQTNTGLDQLTVGLSVRGINTGAIGTVTKVTFDETDANEADAFVNGSVEIDIVSGSFNLGETFEYTVGVGVNAVTYEFVSVGLKSIRAEGEVVSTGIDLTNTLSIARIDTALQGTAEVTDGGFGYEVEGNNEDLGGIVIYTNQLLGRDNIHDFKEGDEVVIAGLPTSNPDLSFLNGKQRIYKVLEDADGRSRRFVIPKKTAYINANYVPASASVSSFTDYVTLTLLNSPNKFDRAAYVARRYQDACNLIRNNTDFIAAEVVGRINKEFAKEYFEVSAVDTGANTFEVRTNPNNFVHTYVSGGTVTYGGTEFTVTDLDYNNLSGVGTITLSSAPTFTDGQTVKIEGIIVSCTVNGVTSQKEYPSFNIPVGDYKCTRDIGHFINALIMDLEFGSNNNIIEAGKKYISGAQIDFVDNEIIQTVRAIEYTRELCILAMRNWRIADGTPLDPIYVPKYATSVARYFDDTVITDTATVNADGTASDGTACADVKSAINTLAYLFVDVLANNASGTYLDAAYLIAKNRDAIADQALLDAQLTYPSLALNTTDEYKCRRDINYVISGLIRDLVLGGNAGIVEVGESYYTGTELTGLPSNEVGPTIYAFDKVKDYAINAMRNWTDGTGVFTTVSPSTATYDSTTGVVTVTFPDPTTAITTSDRIAFKEGAITFNCTSNGGGDLASPTFQDVHNGRSLEITNVSSAGGNTTVTVTVGDAGTVTGVAHTFVSALADGTVVVYDSNRINLADTAIPTFDDWNILPDPSSPDCANVASSITTTMGLLEDILDGTIAPGGTTINTGTLYDTTNIINYASTTLYDADNAIITPKAVWDDLPIIEASPYTQNSSIISFLGGSGALVDGSKVKQPNCPFPGLEPDGSASFPNQGKSMVASAFTIVSFGGTGYKVVEDGYTQLVSVFVIFCEDGILCETGGYASVTNSATNFGTYALRATGFREDPYTFDVGTISGVSSTTGTNRTQFTVSGLGREPLEHYIVKLEGYQNNDPDIEYFIDAVSGVTVGPPFEATLTLESGSGGAAEFVDVNNPGVIVPNNLAEFSGVQISLHRPSIVNSSSHTWEFAGSGTNYNALPENGGTKIEANEQVPQNYGRVYCSGTDELGDFKVGTFAKIENRTGAITFTGTVTISEVEFLKLKGGDVVVTGFDASNTLGGANATDSKLPTQKAVKDYITNNLGPYLNKPYSTNAVPRNLVELTDSGKISIDQIPALRPFSVFTVADENERLELEGALAGDIAIQQDTNISYILNNDNSSLYLGFAVNSNLVFNVGDLYAGDVSELLDENNNNVAGSGGRIQATEYREGVVYQLNITDSGSGYTAAPTVTINYSGAVPSVEAKAVATIANGQVVTLELIEFNGYVGGLGYDQQPTVQISAPGGGGTTATASVLIESRLYGDIVNNIKIIDTDFIDDSDSPTNQVNLTRVVNTSSSLATNWVSLSSSTISVNQITGPGVISSSLLANNSSSANSFTFLRGDSSYAPAVQSFKSAETRYFAILSTQANNGSSQLAFPTNSDVLKGHEVKSSVNGIQPNTTIQNIVTAAGTTTITLNNPVNADIPAGTVIEFERSASPLTLESSYTQGNFIDDIVIVDPGSGYTDDQYFDVTIDGGTGSGCKANIIVSGGEVTDITIVDGGQAYNADFTVTPNPVAIGTGSGLVLAAKLSTQNKQYANVSIDVNRVTDATISADLYGTVGVARFLKSQFNIGDAGNGSVALKTGSDSGLDADLLDGAQGAYYTNASNLSSGSVPIDRMSGTYNISISGQSGNTLRLISSTNNPTSSPNPDTFSVGIVANTLNNTATSLSDGGSRALIMTLRNFGSSTDATGGGARQLGFTDNDNVWIRGSGSTLTGWNSWYKIWSSGNDGPGSQLDADRLDTHQGSWYQNALNINAGTLSDNRLPVYQTHKYFENQLSIRAASGNRRFRIYVQGQLLTTSPFLAGTQVNLYDSDSQGTGTILISSVPTFEDVNDATNNYSIIEGVLQTGTFTGAVGIGTTAITVPFQDFSLDDAGTFEVNKLYSDSGTGKLALGRVDGIAATEPAIYFRSSLVPATGGYNVAMVATGGGATTGSGSLNIIATDSNALTLNSNVVWNAGNIQFASNNVVNTAVKRDASGNFSAGTITANLTGASSLNVLKAGDVMTGDLQWSQTDRGLVWGFNTDGASIKFYNTGDADTNSRLEFNVNDNGDEFFRWTGTQGGSTREYMRLTPSTSDNTGRLQVKGYTNLGTDSRNTSYSPLNVRIASGNAPTSGDQGYFATAVLEKQSDTWNRLRFDRSGKAEWGIASNPQSNFVISRLTNAVGTNGSADDDNFTIKLTNGYVGIQTIDPQYNLQVNGTFAATSKSFCIEHPTKENHNLVYGSLEGPEHAVYVRGKASNVIELPDYWTALVDEDSITVQLTPMGDYHAWVEKIEGNKVFIDGGESFYFVQATRKDILPLEVEVELPTEEKE